MRIGSLFSGFGGLDLAVRRLFQGSHVAWHCEYDEAPSKILAHHWPTVPNYHDVTQIDWDSLPPIEILTGGYPCQPFSASGLRLGENDERHLWPYVREAIRHLRPRYTLLENVAGHRSLGFDRVLGDLAEDGLDVRWTSLRASDIGAPHHRERLFILITRDTHADPESLGRDHGQAENHRPTDREVDTSRDDRDGTSDPDRERHEGGSAAGWADARRSSEVGQRRALSGSGGEVPAHPDCERCRQSAGQPGAGEPKESADLGRVAVLPDPEDDGRERAREARHGRTGPSDGDSGIHWGTYAPAVRRWERLTRPAPAPTELNSNGRPRLSAAFAEWMMGLPAGHVTDPAIGISRAHQLKAIGNGVCPQQAIAAYASILTERRIAA